MCCGRKKLEPKTNVRYNGNPFRPSQGLKKDKKIAPNFIPSVGIFQVYLTNLLKSV